jgi:hypothetical protein
MSSNARLAGSALIETLWYAYANRIVDAAIRLYSLNEDQQKEIRTRFLRRGDYTVGFSDEVIQNKDVCDS